MVHSGLCVGEGGRGVEFTTMGGAVCSPEMLQPLLSECLILVFSHRHHLLQGKQPLLLKPKKGWDRGWDKGGQKVRQGSGMYV